MSTKKLTLTVEDVQKMLHVSRNTAYSIVHQKGFPMIRVSPHRIRIPHAEFLEWLKTNKYRK